MSQKESISRLREYGVTAIPEGWAQSRVKYLGSYTNGYPFKPKDWGSLGRQILRIQNLTSKEQEANRFDGEIPLQYLVRSGDILISWSASLGVFRWGGEESWLNQHIFKVTLDDRMVSKEFFVWLAEWFIAEMGREVHGSTMQHLTSDVFGGFPVLLPPHSDQEAIAKYLDRETTRLDRLVAAKERLLELLTEKRKTLITRAVTRGIVPGVPLRDSEIPWLGEIPAHWETRRNAWLFRDRDLRGEPNLPLLEVSINAGVVLREFSDDRIESTAADFNSYKVARTGDIVFNKMRMWQGAVGTAPVDGLVSPDYTVAAQVRTMSPRYAEQLFRTEIFSAECARRSHGIVWDRLRLYWEGFRDIAVPVPPPDEQRAIIAHIDEETSKLDALRAATEHSVALLKERRAGLIAASVTGQMPIPELQ